MADFTVNLTGTAEVDDSIRQEFDTEFRLAFTEQGVASQFSTLKRDIGAESISLPKYDQLGLAITPLNEREDVDSESLSDSKVVITPQEYGKVVTTTKLANLQTGGMVDRAAARLVGINAGRSRNKLATLALDAGTQILRVGGYATDAEILVGDTMDGSTMGKAFNKLARKNVPGLAGGDYFFIAHDDVIHDIREQSGANSWIDAHKYALPEALLRNEVGMYKGFSGFNALGEAVSADIAMVATGPFDKLNRFVNMGWLGCFNYKIIDNEALVLCKSSSSVGDNA